MTSLYGYHIMCIGLFCVVQLGWDLSFPEWIVCVQMKANCMPICDGNSNADIFGC